MGQAQINVRTRACSGTFIARTTQAALTHNVRGKRLKINIRHHPIKHRLILHEKLNYRISQIFNATNLSFSFVMAGHLARCYGDFVRMNGNAEIYEFHKAI